MSPIRLEGPKETRSMVDALEALLERRVYMYFDPKFAKNPNGFLSTGRQERMAASRFDGKRGETRARETHPLPPQSKCPPQLDATSLRSR